MLCSKSSWIASCLSYELGVYGENWDIINKTGNSTFHNGKTGKFKRDTLLPWNWLKMRVIAKKCVWGKSLKLLDHTRRHCCKNLSEKLQKCFIIIGMKSYFLKEQLQMQSTKHHFVYVYEVVIKYFITCLSFPLAWIRWNSTHCDLIYPMELFKNKASRKMFI